MPATRPPLSAVLITQNAASQLEACLASLDFADEILVVDSGSQDNTRAIAARHGARVVEQPWLGFGPQKQRAVQTASHDWVLCIDADERVPPALASAILDTLAASDRDKHAAYAMTRSNQFLGRYLRHGEGYPDWSVRLFNRRMAQWSDDVVHEKVVTPASIGRIHCSAGLLHHSAESLATYLDKQNRYTSLQAEALWQAGTRPSLVRLLGSPVLRFIKFYVFRLGFMDGLPGLLHIVIGCFNSFSKYAKLYALEREQELAGDGSYDTQNGNAAPGRIANKAPRKSS